MNYLSAFSNRELNIIAYLLIDLLVATYYFGILLSFQGEIDFASKEMGYLIIRIIVFSIALSIIVVGIINYRGEAPRDERDHRIESKAITVAYCVLFICIVAVIGNIIASSAFQFSVFAIDIKPMVLAHVLLLSLLLSSTVKSVYQMSLYRRGAGFGNE